MAAVCHVGLVWGAAVQLTKLFVAGIPCDFFVTIGLIVFT